MPKKDERVSQMQPNGTFVLTRAKGPKRPKRRSKALSKHTKNKRIRLRRRERLVQRQLVAEVQPRWR